MHVDRRVNACRFVSHSTRWSWKWRTAARTWCTSRTTHHCSGSSTSQYQTSWRSPRRTLWPSNQVTRRFPLRFPLSELLIFFWSLSSVVSQDTAMTSPVTFAAIWLATIPQPWPLNSNQTWSRPLLPSISYALSLPGVYLPWEWNWHPPPHSRPVASPRGLPRLTAPLWTGSALRGNAVYWHIFFL